MSITTTSDNQGFWRKRALLGILLVFLAGLGIGAGSAITLVSDAEVLRDKMGQ